MLLPFQSVPKIHAWKDNGVIFLMKSSSSEVNAIKHGNSNQKEKNQKANLIKHLGGATADKSYKMSKLTIGENTLLSICDVDALDEGDNEVKIAFRKTFTDEKKKEKYYRYTFPRLVTSATVRQVKTVVLIEKDGEDCVDETIWLMKLKGMFAELKKSPCKSKWSLQKSIAFLDRFLYLMRETLDAMGDREVATFCKSDDKKVMEVTMEEYDCDQLTGGLQAEE